MVKSKKATVRAENFNLALSTPRIFGLQKLGIHFSVPSVELLAHGFHSNRLRKGQIVQLSNIILQIVNVNTGIFIVLNELPISHSNCP